jgi:hypothetical protein
MKIKMTKLNNLDGWLRGGIIGLGSYIGLWIITGFIWVMGYLLQDTIIANFFSSILGIFFLMIYFITLLVLFVPMIIIRIISAEAIDLILQPAYFFVMPTSLGYIFAGTIIFGIGAILGHLFKVKKNNVE